MSFSLHTEYVAPPRGGAAELPEWGGRAGDRRECDMSVRHALLALLDEGPEYGFALKKGFEQRTADLWPLNVGQVYTTLGRLVRDGLVSEIGDAAAAADDAQRRYELTEAGRHELADWLGTPRPRQVPDRDELVIKLALATHLGDTDLQGMIDDQRSVSTEALQRLTRRKTGLAEDHVGELFALDAAILQVDAELRWLDLCESRLRARPPAPPSTNHGRGDR
jgi:DNA-binding PadR family transcriptional regulator